MLDKVLNEKKKTLKLSSGVNVLKVKKIYVDAQNSKILSMINRGSPRREWW